MGGNLSEGVLEGDIVVCPKHGSRFNVRDGKAEKGPKIILIRFGTGDLNTYPVTVQGGSIMIQV